MTSKPTWDVFISHASEDKKSIATPLSKALDKLGVSVWLDRNEISLGDSLRNKIEEGLSNSGFGVVIISPDFLKKDWTARELDSLLSRETKDKKVILPVWHGCDEDFIKDNFPLLHGKFAASTSLGIPKLAHLISSVIKSSEPNTSAPNIIIVDFLPETTEAQIKYDIRLRRSEQVNLKKYEDDCRFLWEGINKTIGGFTNRDGLSVFSQDIWGLTFYSNPPSRDGRTLGEITGSRTGWGYEESDLYGDGVSLAVSFEDEYEFTHSLLLKNCIRIYLTGSQSDEQLFLSNFTEDDAIRHFRSALSGISEIIEKITGRSDVRLELGKTIYRSESFPLYGSGSYTAMCIVTYK